MNAVVELADTALRRLTLQVVDHGAAVPCVGRREWTYPDGAEDVAEAELACTHCRVLDACHAYAHLERPRSVVLGGLWWDDKRTPHGLLPSRVR